ncbi:hypothetical protein DL764_010171 [Monosporascus ibericus]|uniref:CCHC-type domain-containing protein n=1 Tax=Monosporascus ibericus TaxID=155417 RepID=A0A4Q4ST71_9PEZI|nr:hypothetical protein DL764_010171 [Monosporascus ibericus]
MTSPDIPTPEGTTGANTPAPEQAQSSGMAPPPRPTNSQEFFHGFPLLATVTARLTHDFTPLGRLLEVNEQPQRVLGDVFAAFEDDHRRLDHEQNALQQRLAAAEQSLQQAEQSLHESHQLRERLTTAEQSLQRVGQIALENVQLRERLATAERASQQGLLPYVMPAPPASAPTELSGVGSDGPGQRRHNAGGPQPGPQLFATQPLAAPQQPRPDYAPPASQPLSGMAESQRLRGSEPPVYKGDAKDSMVRQEEYTNWRSLVRLKLAIDRHAYPTPGDRIMYAAQRLQGDAYSRVREKIDEVAARPLNSEAWSHGWRDVDDMLLFLDQVYITVDVLAQAHRDFQGLKQGPMSFADFISDFIRLADQSRQPPALRVISLQQKVNGALQEALVPQVRRPGPEDDTAWIQLFRDLSNNIADRAFLKRMGRPFGNNVPTPQPPSNASEPEPMQLDAATIKSNGPRGPLSEEERQRRRRLNLCMYCGKEGHYFFICPNRRPRPSNQEKD